MNSRRPIGPGGCGCLIVALMLLLIWGLVAYWIFTPRNVPESRPVERSR